MSSLSIGLSGLLVSQKLLDLTGQNIANANTPNYHRQVAELAEQASGSSAGMGVTIKGITRIVNQVLEGAVVRNTSASSGVGSLLDGLNQLESFLAPGEGSLNDAMQTFFAEAVSLSTQPSNMTQRAVVLSRANALADRLNETSDNFSQMRNDLANRAKSSISQINGLLTQIAQLNAQVHDATTGGLAVNGLLDQRDHAIAKLAELVNVQTVPQPFGKVNLLVGGTPIILNSAAVMLSSGVDDQGKMFIHGVNSPIPLDISGGELGGVLNLYNTTLPAVRSQFDSLARGLVTQMDSIHASGLGLGGPMTSLSSQRTVVNTNLPIAAADLSFPPKEGDLYITVTELATGKRSMQKVHIDPATHSLNSLASSINTIPNMQAVVDPQAGTLNLVARPGYGFDFTGSLSSSPDGQAITGTAEPKISGQYTGGANDILTFHALGSGTVGGTQNLALEVRNGAGVLISTLNIGAGYEAGTALADVLGIKISLNTGTFNNGDSFQVNVAATPDSAGILPALGLNSLFVGDSSSGIRVRQDLLDHPERLALSTTGERGDGSNLNKLVALGYQNTMDDGTQSFSQFLANLIGNVGIQAQENTSRKSAYDSLGAQLQSQLQSATGVDYNEELVKLVQFQRSYQMSARVVSVVSQALDELFQIGM